MKEFIEFIVKYLVDKPDEVRVTEIKGEQITVLELRVGAGDLAKVIGKRGLHAKSLRLLLNAASRKIGKFVTLEILE